MSELIRMYREQLDRDKLRKDSGGRIRLRRGKYETWDCTVIDLSGDGASVSYDDLLKLSAASGTTDICLEYEPRGRDYSELTPGDDERVFVVVYYKRMS